MQTITVKTGQTVYDIALERYGTCEAVGEILALNPAITNDPAALSAMGVDSLSEKEFYLDMAVDPRYKLSVDDQSPLRRKNILKELSNDIITYDYGPNNK